MVERARGDPFHIKSQFIVHFSPTTGPIDTKPLAHFDPLILLHLLHPLSTSNNDLLSKIQSRSGVVLSDLSFETTPEIVLLKRHSYLLSKLNKNNNRNNK